MQSYSEEEASEDEIDRSFRPHVDVEIKGWPEKSSDFFVDIEINRRPKRKRETTAEDTAPRKRVDNRGTIVIDDRITRLMGQKARKRSKDCSK